MDLVQLVAGLEAIKRHAPGVGSGPGFLELRLVTGNLVIELSETGNIHVQSTAGAKSSDIRPGGVAREFAEGAKVNVQTIVDGLAIEVRPDSTRREIEMAIELSRRDNLRGVDLLAAAKQKAGAV